MAEQATAVWRAGTSGLVLPVPNKRSFPEAYRSASRLTYYASLFNSIEINSSFYKVPMPATFEKWSASVPDDFRFTVKLWRGITHEKGFHFALPDIDRFIQAANRLGGKKGCLLIQLPPSLRDKMAGQLEKILQRVALSDPEHSWKIAVEFRSRTWYTREVYDLLYQYQASIVLHDMPDSGTMHLPEDTAHLPETITDRSPFVYMRFHGPRGDYKGGYSNELLYAYSERIRTWLSQGKDVYTYFNNTIGDAIPDLTTLKRALHPTALTSQ
jgi:uncharacterized protein YecE (DUF72 family)